MATQRREERRLRQDVMQIVRPATLTTASETCRERENTTSCWTTGNGSASSHFSTGLKGCVSCLCHESLLYTTRRMKEPIRAGVSFFFGERLRFFHCRLCLAHSNRHHPIWTTYQMNPLYPISSDRKQDDGGKEAGTESVFLQKRGSTDTTGYIHSSIGRGCRRHIPT